MYTGYTTNVKRRVSEHNNGDGAKYTRGRTPVELKYVEFHKDKGNAMSREYEIKQLSTRQKQDLIKKDCISIKFNY